MDTAESEHLITSFRTQTSLRVCPVSWLLRQKNSAIGRLRTGLGRIFHLFLPAPQS